MRYDVVQSGVVKHHLAGREVVERPRGFEGVAYNVHFLIMFNQPSYGPCHLTC